MKDLQAEKIKLIYEFNNQSPLFARVAFSEIEKGNYLEAIRILDEGVKLHANYPTAFLILSLAKAYEGKDEEALNMAKLGADIIESPKTYEIYSQKISAIIAERTSLSDALRPAFHNEPSEEQIIVPEEKEERWEDKLDMLAKQLSKAKIIPKDDFETSSESLPKFEGKKIVSETLADIYFSQRNFDEAIKMYEELINIKPEKAEEYLQKIGEMKSVQ